MLGKRIDNLNCLECSEEEVYMDVKEEPGVYKIGAYCESCNHDYGVLHRVSRSETEKMDEIYELGEESITDILEQR